MKYNKKHISILLTIFVVTLIVLSGPAQAVDVSVSQPNDANKGADVSFTVTVDIKSTDILPVQYTNLIITGPNGFSKTCKVNMDGTDDCSDVDVTIKVDSNLGYGYGGVGYGYDSNLGYGYNLGNDASKKYYSVSSGTNGLITYSVIWHTPSTLTDGTYTAKAGVYTEGTSSHTFASKEKSFTISTASATSSGGGGGGGSSPTTYQVSFVNNEVTRTLNVGEQAQFTINGEAHTITVKSLKDGKVTLEIRSDPITAILSVGGTKSVDFNSDGTDDLSVTVQSISGRSVTLLVKTIEKVITPIKKEVQQIVTPEAVTPTEPVKTIENTPKVTGMAALTGFVIANLGKPSVIGAGIAVLMIALLGFGGYHFIYRKKKVAVQKVKK